MAVKQFDFSVLETSGSAAGGDVTSQKPVTYDVLGLLQGAEKLAATLDKKKDIADGLRAREDFRAFKNSDFYKQASDTDKAAAIEAWHTDVAKETPAYRNTWLTVSDSEYFGATTGRETERKTTYINAAPIAFKQDLELQAEQAGLEGRKFTRQDMKHGESFIEKYSKEYNIPPDAVRDSLIYATFDEAQELLSGAKSPEHLKEIEQYIKENRVALSSNKILGSNSMKTRAAVMSGYTQEETIKKAKYNEFVLQAKNYISDMETANYAKTAAELEDKFRLIHTAYGTADLDLDGYRRDMLEYEEKRKIRWERLEYEATHTPTKQLTYSQAQNPEIKKQHEVNTASSILQLISEGKENQLHNTVMAQSGYLDEAKRVSMNILFNTSDKDVDKQAKDTLWKSFDNIAQSPNGYLAVKNIFTSDSEMIQAVINAERYGSLTRDQAIEQVNKWKLSPDREKLTSDVLKDMLEIGLDYGPLNNEFQQIVMMSVASGVDSKTAVNETAKKFDERVTKIGGTVTFNVTGTPPKVSANANDFYNASVKAAIEVLKEKNDGGAVQVEVLNDGKAIIRDATFGYRIDGYIDFTKLAKAAEEYAYRKGPTTAQQNITFLEDKITKLLGGAKEAITTGAEKFYTTEVEPYAKVLQDIVDMTTNKYDERLLLNQGSDGKKALQERGHSIK